MKNNGRNHKLELPLEYSKLSQFYDFLSEDASSTNILIENLLKKNSTQTVLDLSCGTGCQSLWLSRAGFDVTSVDISPNLLKIAKQKAQQEKLKLTFIEGDMRFIKAGTFDAIITIFNAIGHLLKKDFVKALKNININLKKGGIYIFDIFNFEAMTDEVIKNLSMDVKKKSDQVEVHHTQYSKLDRDRRLLVSYDQFLITDNNNLSKTLENQFALQIYSASELKSMLMDAGLRILNQYDTDGSTFLENKSERILTIAQKF